LVAAVGQLSEYPVQPAAWQVSGLTPASRPGPARSIAAIIHLPAPSVEKGKRQQGLD
jgi:hypothetical protein